jgi:uncharacterized protein (TIGR02301 family)
MILRRAIAAGAVACLLATGLVPSGALAQSFFERLFRARPSPQYAPAYPQPQPQYQPQPQPQPQPQQRRAPSQARPSQQPSQPQQAAAPAPEPPPAPYEKELLRLSEIIGSLAFLRSLCATPDATEWPQRMTALLDAEGTTPGRRERLAGAYNKGYQAFAMTYRVCTPSAAEATTRYVREGDTLSRSLSGRYGG